MKLSVLFLCNEMLVVYAASCVCLHSLYLAHERSSLSIRELELHAPIMSRLTV